MRFFWQKKNSQIETLINEYIDTICCCLDSYLAAIDVYFAEGLNEEFERLENKTHRYESLGDDKRVQTEYMIFEKSLIPESREDIMWLLEALDVLANNIETILRIIHSENISIPSEHEELFQRLININVVSANLALQLARQYIAHASSPDIKKLIQDIDEKESQSDKLEQTLIHQFFRSDTVSDFKKIILRDLVMAIGDLSDKSEDVANRINILFVKRIF